jgi:hypothetical protein
MLSKTACPDSSGKSRFAGKTLFITTLFLLFTTFLYSQAEWFKYTGNPVLSGNSGEWDTDISFGNVIFDGSIYKMWYMGGTTTNNNLRIGYATSPDGIEWTRYSGNPVLTPGAPGFFDAGAVGTPTVMLENSVYKMWYAASTTNPPNQIRIGYATSLDGINWTRENNGNPVLALGSPGEWDDYWVTHPTVVKDGSIYKMWYCGSQFPIGTERIGYATSPDGINWTKYNDPSTPNPPYAESDPVVTVGSSGGWDSFLLMQPNVISNNSIFEMWYTGNNGSIQSIGHATSLDGIIWDKDTLNPVMTKSTSGQFDDVFLLAPSVILGSDQIYRMWYTGYGGSPQKRRIGFAATDSSIVPVELESFSATMVGNNINLTWITATELNNHGFELFRNGNKIAFIAGKGTSTEKQEYFYEDANLKPGIYNYRLEQIDFDGTRSIVSKEITVYLTLPERFSLEQNYPNPFNPSTVISWQSPVSSWQTLKVYDLLGREVATLVDEYKPAGRYEVEFDGRNLSTGSYFYRLQVGEFMETKKLILLK